MDIEDILTAFDQGTNLCDHIDDDRLDEIGSQVIADYKKDKESRREWEQKIGEGIKLALQVYEKKNTPWPGASNVKLPLITIPSLQFSSRVYPALISGTEIVKMRAIGKDPDGSKNARAKRVSKHMSYQVLEEDEEWESEMDLALITLPLLGCAFKKVYFDPEKQHMCSKHVFAKDLVIHYYARSLKSARTVTHVFEEFKNEIKEKIRLGIYQEVELTEPTHAQEYLDQERDDREGRYPAGEKPYQILEQHRYLDLDDDGYDEPYVVTVNPDTEKVLRIFPRFAAENVTYRKGKVAKIEPIQHFVKYTFVPNPDGSIYDLGFFQLVGPINESANTLVNQLIDAGTLANRPPGFIGRGARLKGGDLNYRVGELKQVNVTGDDLKKSIFFVPFREPSQVLFSLLSMLMQYAERTSSVTEMMMGETPGQNTPATTAMAALEQGEKVFVGIFKRVYRAMRDEFRVRYNLNKIYLEEEEYYQVLDEGRDERVFRQDYFGDPTDVRPAADPNVISSAQRLAKVEALGARSQVYYGYNKHAIEQRYLEALQIPAPEEVLPSEPPQPPPNPDAQKIEVEQMKAKRDAVTQAGKLEIERERLQIDARKADAELAVQETQALLNLAKAEAEEADAQIQLYKAQLEDIKSQREAVANVIQTAVSRMDRGSDNQGGNEVSD